MSEEKMSKTTAKDSQADKTDSQPEVKAKARTGEKRYKIVIHSRSEHDEPFVDGIVNGVSYRIRRGVPAEVRESVFNALKDAVEKRPKKEMVGGKEEIRYYDMPRFTVEMLGQVNA